MEKSLINGEPLRALVLEDSAADAKLVVHSLKSAGFDINADIVRNAQGFKEKIESQPYDIILGDYRLPDWTGLEAILWLRGTGDVTPFVLVTGSLGEERAIECLKAGVDDYILKDKLARLPVAVRRARERLKIQQERDRAEKEVRASEEKYRLLFQANPQPMWVYEQHSLRFLAVNSAAIEHYGYSQEEFLAMTLADIRPAEEVNRLLDHINAQTRSGPTKWFQEPWKHRKKDGTIIEVEISSEPIDFGGAEAKLVLAHDVTEERKLEQQFRQAQKMEAIGRLAGGVAHDFNNLLMVIGSFAELIGRNAENPEKSTEYLAHIRGAVGKAASLTRQLLAFSRKQMLDLRVLNFNELVADLCKMLPAMLGEDVRMTLSTTGRECPVYSDKTQIEQVIMNLAVNARDAMPDGGELAIETSRVYLDGKYFQGHGTPPAPGEYVLLSVADTGEGMDAATQARIFEPFFSTKEPGKGTGLGLATVFGIVKQSGGFLWVYSEPGNGSTFKVYLPCAETESEAAASVPVEVEEVGGNETILLVEDEQAVRIATMEFLQSKGYTVLPASNDLEALRATNTPCVHIDLLLTDLVMPGMGGKELAEKITREHPGTKVIFMSGYAERIASVNGLGPSAAYLQKPFTLTTLASTIRRVLDGPERGLYGGSSRPK